MHDVPTYLNKALVGSFNKIVATLLCYDNSQTSGMQQKNIALVTGSSSGIGFHTSLFIAN